MLAIRATQFGDPDVLTLAEVERPTAGAGQILIRVESASVNFADIVRRRNGPYPFPTMLPYTPGSEIAGTIEALGPGVSGPPVGTRVFALAGIGLEAGSTGYAQYATADASNVAPIPPGMTSDEACTILVAGLSALIMLRHTARVNAGEVVLVQGAAGGVGAYAVQVAKALGASRVIGAVGHASRAAAAIAHGADDVVVYGTPDWAAEVRALTNDAGADVVLEMRGGSSVGESLGALAPFGRLVVFGMASGSPLSLSAEQIMQTFYVPAPNQTLHAFNLGLWFALRPQLAGAAIGELLEMIGAGRVRVPPVRAVALATAAHAHRAIETRESVGKLVLKPWA